MIQTQSNLSNALRNKTAQIAMENGGPGVNEVFMDFLSLPTAILAGLAGGVGAAFGGIVGTLVSKLFRIKIKNNLGKINLVTIMIILVFALASGQVLKVSLFTLRKEMGVELGTGG